MRGSRLLLALVLIGIPTRSEPASTPRFALVARTSHGDYFAARGRDVDVERTEAFLEKLSSLFGPPPAEWRIQYFRHASVGELSDHVGYSASGVADLATGRIDSSREFHPHELVHAVTGRVGTPPTLFAEGLAVALTARGRWHGAESDEIAAREMDRLGTLEPFLSSFADQDPVVAYAVAGSFVGFLLDRAGIEPMVAFVRGCGHSSARYERAFRRAYGCSVARYTLEWMAWLRRGERGTARAWYDTAAWPEALRHGTPASTPALDAPEPSRLVVARPVAEPSIVAER